MTAHQKFAVAKKLLRAGDIIVSIDPRRLGVLVPDIYKRQHQLDLRISGFTSATGASATKRGLVGTCRDSAGNLVAADIPWHSVYAIAADNDPTSGKVWVHDFPPEITNKFRALNGLAKCGPEPRQRAVSTKVAKVVDLGAYRARKALVR